MRFPIIACATLLVVPVLAAAPRATPAEAKALLKEAVAYYGKNGREKALKTFNSSQGAFTKGELYVFCIGPDRKLLADGHYAQYVGQDADQIKDSKGKSLGSAFLAAVGKTGQGELHYNWFNPVTQLIEPKVSFLARAGKDVCGVGTYDTK
jgi:hypothetical protein